MIKEIEIINSSGISEKISLKFNAGKYSYKSEYVDDGILKSIFLYGSNGSGKTSVLKSINTIIKLFAGDLTTGENIAMPHMFSNELVTKIVLKFLLDDKLYTYKVAIKDGNKIDSEFLSVDKKELFNRIENKVEYSSVSSDDFAKVSNYLKGIELSDKVSIIREVGRQDMDIEFTNLYNYLKNIKFIGTNKEVSEISTDNLTKGERLVKYNDKYEEVLCELNHIMKLRFKTELTSLGERIIAVYKHNNKEFNLDFNTMVSSGTRELYYTLAEIYSLKKGGILIMDEVEKTFHPELLDKLIAIIAKTQDIQIIASSHNAHLLQSLRPDQIFLVNKNESDVVTVDKLSDKHPGIREIHNIEKLYFGGKFE